jgi:hypothetical protein
VNAIELSRGLSFPQCANKVYFYNIYSAAFNAHDELLCVGKLSLTVSLNFLRGAANRKCFLFLQDLTLCVDLKSKIIDLWT